MNHGLSIRSRRTWYDLRLRLRKYVQKRTQGCHHHDKNEIISKSHEGMQILELLLSKINRLLTLNVRLDCKINFIKK